MIVPGLARSGSAARSFQRPVGRGSHSQFDLLLEDLERMYAGRFHKFQFINPTRASFSWHIQSHDLNEMKRATQKEGNRQELARLVEVSGN